jgi:hypothetical protein
MNEELIENPTEPGQKAGTDVIDLPSSAENPVPESQLSESEFLPLTYEEHNRFPQGRWSPRKII